MRNSVPYPASPAPRQRRGSAAPDMARSATAGFARKTEEGGALSTQRMFEQFENKAEVEILNSPAEDKLAASMYGGVKKNKKKKIKKQKKGVSGYDFDSLIKDESSSSSGYDFH